MTDGNIPFQVMPPLSDADYEALKADIAERGLMVPIEVDEDGNILDGHHRQRICNELKVPCQRFVRTGLNEAGKRTHARRLNIARRHLNEKQKRTLIADELRDDPERSNRQIGAALGVDHKTVAAVRSDHEGRGEIPRVSIVTDTKGRKQPAKKPQRARLTKIEFDDTDSETRAAIKVTEKQARTKENAKKRAKRNAKLTELSNYNAPLPQDRAYPIIYADPPWKYDFSPSSGRAVENHYATMPIEEILALPVERLATDDAMLFLWAPPSFIHKGLATIEAWGFEFASSAVWVKDKIGTGVYFRQKHEYLLLGKRGRPITPVPGTQPASVFEAPRGRHSEKPDRGYQIIEQMYPDLPKIELFAREQRDGWAAWGNESNAA